MAKDGKKVAIGLGVAAIAGVIFLLIRKAEAAEILLYTGWNEVTYTGKNQIAGVAMESISPYLEVAYYYDAFAGIWKQILYDTLLESGMVVSIKVTQDSIWRF